MVTLSFYKVLIAFLWIENLRSVPYFFVSSIFLTCVLMFYWLIVDFSNFLLMIFSWIYVTESCTSYYFFWNLFLLFWFFLDFSSFSWFLDFSSIDHFINDMEIYIWRNIGEKLISNAEYTYTNDVIYYLPAHLINLAFSILSWFSHFSWFLDFLQILIFFSLLLKPVFWESIREIVTSHVFFFILHI